jgi:hypothetical protein
MWKPKQQARGSLPKQLKRAISRRLWDTDGSCGDGIVILGHSDIPYLDGLKDAGIDGAKELISLIIAHDEVELWHE